MNDLSTRPYLVRAIYEWCVDSGLTPYLAVSVNDRTFVPQAYVREGQITLSLSASAVRDLQIANDFITCSARFGGVPFDIVVPLDAVAGIFAKENGQGLVFQPGETPPPESVPPKRPQLKIVK
jgi:stringent starvation protein B